MSWTETRQLRVQLPVIGWFTAPAFGYHVGVELSRRWSVPGRLCDVAAQAVAAHCEEREGERCLTVLVTFTAAPTQARRIDGVAMDRDITAAVSAAVTESRRDAALGHQVPVFIDLDAARAAAAPWPRRPW